MKLTDKQKRAIGPEGELSIFEKMPFAIKVILGVLVGSLLGCLFMLTIYTFK